MVTQKVFTNESLRSEVGKLLRKYKQLNSHGGVFSRYQTTPEARKRARDELVSPEGLSQITTALEFLAGAPKAKVGQRDSYAWKHVCENQFRDVGDYCYVSNGAFICAALIAGYMRPEAVCELNCLCDIRPTWNGRR